MNLFYQPGIPDGINFLDAEESRHCVRVLRKKNGDEIIITDGLGFFYHATIQDAAPNQCLFSVSRKEKEAERKFNIHIAISPTKNPDRTEWFIEKAVEIGIDNISLIVCRNSERTKIKTERIQKLAVSAMKQAQRATLPRISDLMAFNELINIVDEDQKFIAFVDHTNPVHLFKIAKPTLSSVVLIGPEGDFSREELIKAEQNGFKKVSLGDHRLRTETAGLMACSILNILNE